MVPADGFFWGLFWGMLGLMGINLAFLVYNGHKGVTFGFGGLQWAGNAVFAGALECLVFLGPLGQGSGQRVHFPPLGEASFGAIGFLGPFLGYAGGIWG